MASQQEVAQGNGGKQAVQGKGATQAAAAQGRGQRGESSIRPPVDIFETSDGITLQADMPGVSKDRLNVQVEGNTLIVEGNLEIDMADKIEALYADVRSTLYRCSFVLSPELESDRIDASLKDGVLSVRIPKRAELRPRRIDVQAG
jgi:HSP20 family molecular chaperone IbpA